MGWLALFGFGPAGWGGLLLLAAGTTLEVTLASLAIGAALGGLVAAGKLSRAAPPRLLADAYTTAFRGVPELLVIYFVYFGGSTLASRVGAWFGGAGFLGLPSFLAGALAVGVISGAYQAEVFRGAFLSIGVGEREAARAVGMSTALRLRRVIAPQVLRLALPGLGNVWQLTLKDSALVSVTGLAELMRTAQVGAGSTHAYFAFYIAGGALYLALTSLSGRVCSPSSRRAPPAPCRARWAARSAQLRNA